MVLSSGFLAFASHSGFLKAVDRAGLAVGGVMGTSAGALSGSLYSAGYSPDEVLHIPSSDNASIVVTKGPDVVRLEHVRLADSPLSSALA